MSIILNNSMLELFPKTYFYKNGNYCVEFDGETKIYRAFRRNEELISDFPDSIDLKVSGRCRIGCPWCHESSTMEGKIFDYNKTINILSQLPEYPIEIAIGGGDVLENPEEIMELIRWLNNKNYKPRLTVNIKSLTQNITVEQETLLKLVHTIGISINSYKELDNFFKNILQGSIKNIILDKRLVFHVIAGLFPPEDMESVLKIGGKLLILGYKQFGRAEGTKIPDLSPTISVIPELLKRPIGTIGFDNLAIEQLGIKGMIDKKTWESYFMGEEGSHSMYIDAVEGKFAKTSRSHERVSWDEVGLIEYFKSLRNDNTSY